MPVARLYLVRHGETEENRRGIIQGHLDTELNAAGLRQSELVAQALQSVPFEKAYSSDLTRAVKTAEIILKYHTGVTLHRQQELREKFMGRRQGMPVAAARSIKGPVEESTAFTQRIMTWWNSATAHIASLDSTTDTYHILVVTHGHFLRNLVKEILRGGTVNSKGSGDSNIGNCLNSSVTLIEVEDMDAVNVIKYGDIEHLVLENLAQDVVEVNADEVVVDTQSLPESVPGDASATSLPVDPRCDHLAPGSS